MATICGRKCVLVLRAPSSTFCTFASSAVIVAWSAFCKLNRDCFHYHSYVELHHPHPSSWLHDENEDLVFSPWDDKKNIFLTGCNVTNTTFTPRNILNSWYVNVIRGTNRWYNFTTCQLRIQPRRSYSAITSCFVAKQMITGPTVICMISPTAHFVPGSSQLRCGLIFGTLHRMLPKRYNSIYVRPCATLQEIFLQHCFGILQQWSRNVSSSRAKNKSNAILYGVKASNMEHLISKACQK